MLYFVFGKPLKTTNQSFFYVKIFVARSKIVLTHGTGLDLLQEVFSPFSPTTF